MLHPTPIHPRRIAALYEHRVERELSCADDEADAMEAERQFGAEKAVEELIAAARRTAHALENEPAETRARLFIARFCGSIQPGFLDLAKEIAAAAGMPHLYADEV
ncbi:hypothetical protein [Burkholderia cenocepacia]|uniref:hypothetical protein n=1 Tax=Burkholderia cenocepacia TaxID=95486 RepID=UPI00222E148D|nr:hypothetical protein [Burkholderia cenocepacia]MCW3678242.1 hypothetical protein [Burkholderia cenocepacia]